MKCNGQVMYVPSYYREKSLGRMLALARSHNFGVIISTRDDKAQATHLPLLVQQDGSASETGISIMGHFAAANAQARSLRTGDEVLCIFSGPSGYITPKWYRDEDDVPTFNYAAVHMRGIYRPISDREEIHHAMAVTVERYESTNSPPWRMDEIDPALLDKFMQSVTCFSVAVSLIEGVSKHSQDKSESDRESVLLGLKNRGSHEDIQLAVDMEKSLRPDAR